jgi:hypothetical protein
MIGSPLKFFLRGIFHPLPASPLDGEEFVIVIPRESRKPAMIFSWAIHESPLPTPLQLSLKQGGETGEDSPP